MPRLRQVSRHETDDELTLQMYDQLFGPDRDPVAEPGTATGHARRLVDRVRPRRPTCCATAVRGFALYRSPERLARPGAARARPDPGRLAARQPVRVLPALQVVPHRRHQRGEDRRHPELVVVDVFDERERAVLAYTDALVGGDGRVPDALFDELQDAPLRRGDPRADLHHGMYEMHAIMSRALRLEFDDRDDPIVEIAGDPSSLAADVGRMISREDA